MDKSLYGFSTTIQYQLSNVIPYLVVCFSGRQLVDKFGISFASGTTGMVYLLVGSNSRKHGAGHLGVFAGQTHCSKVIDANKMLGQCSNTLVQDVCINQKLG